MLIYVNIIRQQQFVDIMLYSLCKIGANRVYLAVRNVIIISSHVLNN